MLYVYLLGERFFHESLLQTLTAAIARRDFGFCRDACQALVRDQPAISADALVRAVALGLPFDRKAWQALVGEFIVYGALDIPRLQTMPETLRSLLAPGWVAGGSRGDWPPIEQAHFGAHDMVFGNAFYRPEHAGVNLAPDVARLHEYLRTVDTGVWRAEDLVHVPETQRDDELADARDWFPDLQALYSRAHSLRCVVVCEAL